jgi:hypothetical protein
MAGCVKVGNDHLVASNKYKMNWLIMQWRKEYGWLPAMKSKINWLITQWRKEYRGMPEERKWSSGCQQNDYSINSLIPIGVKKRKWWDAWGLQWSSVCQQWLLNQLANIRVKNKNMAGCLKVGNANDPLVSSNDY